MFRNVDMKQSGPKVGHVHKWAPQAFKPRQLHWKAPFQQDDRRIGWLVFIFQLGSKQPIKTRP